MRTLSLRAPLAWLTIASLVFTLVAPAVSLSAQAAAKPAVAKPAAAKPAAAAPVPPDGGWPRNYVTSSGAALVLYQPQIASWTSQKHIVAYTAISYTPKGAAKPALGTVKVESQTSVALDERLVSFSELKLAEPNFPTLPREQLKMVVDEITASIPLAARVIALDRVLASVDTSDITAKNVEGVKADPPPLFFSKTPAVLVNIDGEAIWSPIPQNDLTSAINTNWDLFSHGPTKTFYLRNEKVWLKAADVKGPWSPAGKLPESFAKLPADANWADVKETLPGKSISASQAPKVFVSLVPAEMILLKGEPSYVAVQGAEQLLWVSNTESDVFRMGLKGDVYVLISGRWFSAPDFTGPWTFATPKMPEDFKKIPLEHARSRVLASVPGTRQAAEAIMLAQIPQTARVAKTVTAPEVAYEGGTPQFQPIETTTVQRAVNTDKDIFKVGDLYYMCFQGVWFMSREAAGPWTVTGEVPAAIYTIPVSSPSYPVTHVTVIESNDDAVTYATAAAFTGAMIAFGCVVWGTGYYYPPYIGYGYGYPYYRPYYPSYGFGASYNPWSGAYTRGAVAYGPYGGAGVAQRYNPRTGTYSRGAAVYGPYGSRGAASAYNPRTGTAAATRQGSGVYGSWGQTGVSRGDSWATSSRVTNDVSDVTRRKTETSGGGEAYRKTGPNGSGGVARTGSGDVYAGKDGNVYRKEGDGWQNVGGDGARPTPSGVDSATAGQLDRDRAARAEGTQRTRDAGTVNSGASSRSGSYRPSGSSGGASRGGGGASRGGGGRRR